MIFLGDESIFEYFQLSILVIFFNVLKTVESAALNNSIKTKHGCNTVINFLFQDHKRKRFQFTMTTLRHRSPDIHISSKFTFALKLNTLNTFHRVGLTNILF